MGYFQFTSAIIAALEFNVIPYLVASVATSAAASPLVAYGWRGVNDLRLARNVKR